MSLDFSPVWISLKTAALATIIAFFIGAIAARWMFKYQGKGKGLIDGIFTAPWYFRQQLWASFYYYY